MWQPALLGRTGPTPTAQGLNPKIITPKRIPGSGVRCCFTFTETADLLGTGAQDGHLSFHAALEIWRIRVVEVEVYTTLQFHHQNAFCMKGGSDGSHFMFH